MSPHGIELSLMLSLLDTAALLLSVVTARKMAGGLFHLPLGSYLLQFYDRLPLTPPTVTWYPDGTDTYTLQLRFFAPVGGGEASLVLTAPTHNDTPDAIRVDHAANRSSTWTSQH